VRPAELDSAAQKEKRQNVRLAHRPQACVPNFRDDGGSGGCRWTMPMAAASAIIQGAKNASATPIMRTLHIDALVPCSMVRRMVAGRPDPSATRLPWE